MAGRPRLAKRVVGHSMVRFESPRQGHDSQRALDLIAEAWDQGVERGIAPELMAYAALYAALTDLVAAFGEDAVARLAAGLEPRVRQGEFTLGATRH